MKLNKETASILLYKVNEQTQQNIEKIRKEAFNDKDIIKKAKELVSISEKNKELLNYLGYTLNTVDLNFFKSKLIYEKIEKAKQESKLSRYAIQNIQYMALECKDLEELKAKLNLK